MQKRTHPLAKPPPNRNRKTIVFAYANTSCGYPQDDDLSTPANCKQSPPTQAAGKENFNETENRKEATELFAHVGTGHRADAGDEFDGAGSG